MEEKISIEILSSYKSENSAFIIVYLKNPGFALKKGYLLSSERNDLQWEIINRYVDHFVRDRQEIFEGEEIAVLPAKIKGGNIEYYTQRVLDRDWKREFMYRLRACGHDTQPEQGEKLVLKMT